MSEFEGYSLAGCLVDPDYDAPKLKSLGGSDPMAAVGASADAIPPKIDLRQYCSGVEDQQTTNSCVANAVVGALELLQRKQGHSSHDLSRLFIYYNARRFHSQDVKDQGTFVHFAMASLIAQGVCEERMWPFSKVTINDPPTQACYENAQHYRGVEFAQIEKGTPLTHILAREIPVVIGVELPRECYVAANQTGVMSIPSNGGGGSFQHGRHAMVVVGYDLEQKAYIVRNSWGEKFANGGYFLMPMKLFDSSSMPAQNWAIGALNGAPGLELLGASVKQSVQGMVASSVSPQFLNTEPLRQKVQAEMQSRLDKTKSGFRSRLRGN